MKHSYGHCIRTPVGLPGAGSRIGVTLRQSIRGLMGPRLAAVIGACALGASFALLGGSATSLASTSVTLYVDGTNGTMTTGCTGPGTSACETVQEGINAAETYGSSDVTILVAAGIYTENDVTAGDYPAPGYSLTIEGAGAPLTAVDGAGLGPVFDIGPSSDDNVTSGPITIEGLTITNGSNTNGGGVSDDVLEVTDLTLSDDTFSDDTAEFGGAFFNVGTATVTNDTFVNDSAVYPVVGSQGGGVFNDGTATLTNDTFVKDSADYGGGLFTVPDYTSTLTNDTFYNDPTGGGIYTAGATTTVANSIIDDAPCSGAVTDEGNNVEDDTSCGLAGDDSADINLSPVLAANGSTGPETAAIGPNSSAYEEVPLADCPATDERGDTRPGIPLASDCDAGAYEYQLPTISTLRSPAAASLGATLQDSATLGNIYNLSGTGSITFDLYGTTDPTCSATPVYSTTVSDITGDGPWSTTTGSPDTGYVASTPGTYNWIATYTGDANNLTLSTLCLSESVRIAPAFTSLSTSPNVSTATFGTPTKLKDTATLSGGSNPTGTITFTLYNGPTLVYAPAPVAVAGDGPYASPGYTLPVTNVSAVAGTYQWDATYSGDEYNGGASDIGATNEQVVVSPAGTTLTYTGPAQVVSGSSFSATASLTSTAAACQNKQPVTFTVTPDPLNPNIASLTVPGTGTTSTATPPTASSASLTVSTKNWEDGVYTITADYAGTTNCSSATSSIVTLAVTKPGLAAFGAGRYTVPDLGQTNFGFEASLVPHSKSVYVGQLDVVTPGYWWFQADVTSDGITSPTQAILGGTGTLYWWNPSLNRGHGGWAGAAPNLTYKATANAATKSTKASFGVEFTFTPTGSEPKVPPTSPPETLSSGGIISF